MRRIYKNSNGSATLYNWQAEKIKHLIVDITNDLEQNSAKNILNDAIRRVPVGRYGQYRTKRHRNPLIRRGKQRRKYADKEWKRRRAGTLKASLKRVRSKFQDGGELVWAGREQSKVGGVLPYYAHFVEFGTVFMKKRKGYRFMRLSLLKERRRFYRKIKAAFAGDMPG